MAAWPDSLPAPLRSISVTAGSNMSRQEWQSGRADNRRFGSGAPDRVKVQLRLHYTQIPTFEYWYNRDANMGINWFTADWLANLGYTSHMARLVGYPKLKGKSTVYADYTMTLLVQEAIYCPDDTEWPSGGGESGDTPAVNANVMELDYTGNYTDSGVAGVKVRGPYNSGFYKIVITSTGSLLMISGTGSSAISGYDALGGIAEICFPEYRAMVYLTTDGVVSAIGTLATSWGFDSPPRFSDDVIDIQAGYGWVAALCADGTVKTWGQYKSTFGISDETGVAAISAGRSDLLCLKTDGSLSASGSSDVTDDIPSGTDFIFAYSDYQWAVAFDSSNNATYWGVDGSSLSAYHPSGLSPLMMAGCAWLSNYPQAAAIHSDNTLVVWGANSQAVPENTKAVFVHDAILVNRSVYYIIEAS